MYLPGSELLMLLQDSEEKCVGLEDEGDLWKGCDCWDDTKPSFTYHAFNAQDFAAAQAELAGLPDVGTMAPSSTADPSKITCWGNNVQSVPGELVSEAGTVDPNNLLYRLREGKLVVHHRRPG